MAIKIKNLNSGRLIIVKNQDDINNLKNTGLEYDFDEDNEFNDWFSSRNLDKADDKDKEEYINRFSFDKQAADDDSYDTPINPTKDVYFDFDEEDKQDEDSNYQGQIRSVTGARLEYKRQAQDGTYTELWIFTIGKDMASEYAIRKAIISGTDIDPNTQESDDGTQKCKSISLGNVQFVYITGLPQ